METVPPSAAAGDKGKVPDPAAVKTEDWRDRRIAQLTAKLRESEATKAKAPTVDPAVAPQPALTEAEIQQRVRQQVAQDEFARRCNDAVAAGRGEYADFDSRTNEIRSIVNPTDVSEVTAYNRLIEATLDTGEGPRLLYELGGNKNEAARLLELAQSNPTRLGIEVARLAAKQSEAEPSKAPKPLTPIGGRGGSHEQIDPKDAERADRLDTKTWINRRQAEVDKRRAAGERIW